jgi:hypothetical protein
VQEPAPHSVAVEAAALVLHMRLWRCGQGRAVFRKACPLLATGGTAQLLSHAACVQLQRICRTGAGDGPASAVGIGAGSSSGGDATSPVQPDSEMQQSVVSEAVLQQQWLACAIQQLTGATRQADSGSGQGSTPVSTAASSSAPHTAAQQTVARCSTDAHLLTEADRKQSLQGPARRQGDTGTSHVHVEEAELCAQLIRTILSSSSAATAVDRSTGSMQQATHAKQVDRGPGVQEDSVQDSPITAPEVLCGLPGLHGWLEAAVYKPCSTCHSSWCHSSWLCAAAVLQCVQASSSAGGGSEAQALLRQHVDTCACCAKLLFRSAAPKCGSGQEWDCGTPARLRVSDVPVSDACPVQQAAGLHQRLQSAAMDLDQALAAVTASLQCKACQADAAAAYVRAARGQLASCQAMRRGFLAAAALQAAGCEGS